MMNPFTIRGPRRLPRGMTMIELLVVISIMIIVFAAIVPRIKPAIDDLKLREAARATATTISAAQAAAVQSKRPHGVRLMPINGLNSGVLELVSLETPPPYAGDTLNSVCNVSVSGGTGSGTFSGASLITNLGIGPGDTIRFNYRGPFYVIQTASPANVTFVYNGTGPLVPGMYPFQIYRKPIRSSGSAMQLPRGVCIDSQFCGEGPTGTFGGGEVIDVMFQPDGRPFYYRNGNPVAPQASLYFLMGRLDKVADATNTNLLDVANRWISVRALSGQCIVFENQPGGNVAAARTLAATGQSMGGN